MDRKTQMPGRENQPHIGIYGRCNAGKSSLLNFITGAPAALVSAESGTTTDPVRRSYEILGFGPVVLIDTAGLDDTSSLGTVRATRTLETLLQIDLAVLLFTDWTNTEREVVGHFRSLGLPFLLVYNIVGAHALSSDTLLKIVSETGKEVLMTDVLSEDDGQRDGLLEAVQSALPEGSYRTPSLFGGRVSRGDTVLLVCPIDSEAPAGRLILPQVQALRDLLDRHAVAVTVQPAEVASFFALGVRPRLVVTDSQLFREVCEAVPEGIEVTSFSILLAAAKGDYAAYSAGLEAVDGLKNGDRVLILENCSHQVSCDDIGRVKIPRWLEEYTGASLSFTVVSGLSPLPADLVRYALVVQCGGCMVTRSQLQNRIRTVQAAGVPVTNYGMLIRKLRVGEKQK